MAGYSLGSARGRGILGATILASGAAFLLGSAVNVALPTIQSAFGTDLSALQWVVNAQLLTLAALLPIGGSLGDRFGRKRLFLAGIAMFTVAGVLSGLAKTPNVLIGWQAVLGIGSALMVPQSLAIINVSFAENRRGQAIGLWAGLSGGIAALGPWLGGWLVQTFSWPAVFFMAAAVGVIAFVITLLLVPESRNPAARRLDWAGTVCLLGGLFGIAFGLISGPSGWTRPVALISLLGGAAVLAVFVWIERRQSEPLVPLHIFRNPLVSGANLATLLLYCALNGVLLFPVLNLQQVQGYSPSAAGLALLPVIVLITFLSGPAGSLADKLGPRPQMIIGPLLVAVGAGLLAVGGTSILYPRDFLPGAVLIGLGMALVIAPLTKSALAVRPELSGAASGVNNAAARVAALLAVAVLGAIMVSIFSARLPGALAVSVLTGPEQQQIIDQSGKLGGIVVPEALSAAAREAAKQAIARSFVFSFRWVMLTCAALALGAALVSTALIRRPAGRR